MVYRHVSIFVAIGYLISFTSEISMNYDAEKSLSKENTNYLITNHGTGRLFGSIFAGGNSTLFPGGSFNPSQFLNLGLNNTAGLLQLLGAKLLISAFALSVAAAIAGLAVGVATAPALKRYSDYDYDGDKSEYYDRYNARSFNTHSNSVQLSILEWIEIFESIYRNSDQNNPECFERFLCEIQQSTKLKRLTRGINNIANYGMIFTTMGLQTHLPIQMDIENLMEAILRGQKRGTNCEYHYGSCQFSIKEIGIKYFHDIPLEIDDIHDNNLSEKDSQYLES